MLVGTFRSMTLAELLRWADEGAKTGTLKVTRARSTVLLHFADGRIRGSSSNDPPALLGQFLVSRGRITEDVLNEAMIEHQKGERGLGSVLIAMNAVNAEELVRYCAAKVEEVVFELLDTQEAVFEFDVDGRIDPSMTRMDLSARDLMMSAATRSDECRRMRAELAGPAVVLQKTEVPMNPETANSPVAQRLFDAIDGKRSFSEIVLHARASEYLATKFLYGMKQRGVVRIVDSGRSAPDESIVEVARSLRTRGDLEASMDLLLRTLTDRPEHYDARAELESVEIEYLDKMYSSVIPRNARVLGQPSGGDTNKEGLTSAENYLLDLVRPEKWTVEDLIRIAPMHELDIVRNLDRLRLRGLVDFAQAEPVREDSPKESLFSDRSLMDNIDASLDLTIQGGGGSEK